MGGAVVDGCLQTTSSLIHQGAADLQAKKAHPNYTHRIVHLQLQLFVCNRRVGVIPCAME